MTKAKNRCDKIVMICAECYIVLPIIIFMFGWLKTMYAIAGCIMIIGLAVTLYRALGKTEKGSIDIFSRKNVTFWVAVIIISAIWVYMSGIGGYAYQNGDHWARNPIFNDLSTYSWPVVFDLSAESKIVKSICGDGEVAFSYYFSWWLPVCLIAKVFNLAYNVRNVLLYSWALLGILLIIYLMCRKFGYVCIGGVIALMAFSGLDAIPIWMSHNFFDTFPWNGHIEWWAHYFQYSSHTTQLFWVFNQSITIWLIVAVLIQLDDAKCIAGLSSLAFAYSPWATFGMVPYAIYGSVKGKKEIKSAVNPFNLLVPAVMLIVFGTFYMAGSGSDGYIGFIFMKYPDEKRRILCNYLLFILFEFGLFYLVMGREAFGYKYYWVTLLELILFPLFIVRDGNFIMRGSIPALFMTMVYVVSYLLKNKDSKSHKSRKYMLIGILGLGFLTPLSEINRTLVQTSTNDNILQEQVGSFGNIQTEDEGLIKVTRVQFFVYDYENKFFFKYLARDGK